jgi:hypothetical protein
MSAEALRAVMRHSTCRGHQLLVQLAIAHLSDSRRGHYPRTTARQEDIAKAARMSLPRLKAVLPEMIAKGRLFIVEKGTGHTPHTYELPIRGVLKTSDLEVSEPIPLIREEPYTQTSRAEFQSAETPQNVIPITYVKPKRKRKA